MRQRNRRRPSRTILARRRRLQEVRRVELGAEKRREAARGCRWDEEFGGERKVGCWGAGYARRPFLIVGLPGLRRGDRAQGLRDGRRAWRGCETNRWSLLSGMRRKDVLHSSMSHPLLDRHRRCEDPISSRAKERSEYGEVARHSEVGMERRLCRSNLSLEFANLGLHHPKSVNARTSTERKERTRSICALVAGCRLKASTSPCFISPENVRGNEYSPFSPRGRGVSITPARRASCKPGGSAPSSSVTGDRG